MAIGTMERETEVQAEALKAELESVRRELGSIIEASIDTQTFAVKEGQEKALSDKAGMILQARERVNALKDASTPELEGELGVFDAKLKAAADFVEANGEY